MSEDTDRKAVEIKEAFDKRLDEIEGKMITQAEHDSVVDGLKAEYKKLEESSTAQQGELAASIADMNEEFASRMDTLHNSVRPDVNGRMLGHSGLALDHEQLVASMRDDYAGAPVETAKRMSRDAYDAHFDYLQRQVATRWGLTSVPSLAFLRRVGIQAQEAKDNVGRVFEDDGLRRRVADIEQDVGGAGNLFATAVFGTSWANVLLESPLLARLPAIPMATQVMDVPYWPDSLYQGWNVVDRATVLSYQNVDDAKVTLTAREFSKAHLIEQATMEDSVIDLIGDVMTALTMGFAFAAEDAVVNSDQSATGATATGVTTGGQNINGVTTGDVPKRAFPKGLRKLAFENSDTVVNINGNITSTVNADALNRISGLLGPAGVVPGEQIYVLPINLYRKLMGVAPYSTLDKIGSMAAVLTGVMPSVGRADVIWSTAFPTGTGSGGGGVPTANANRLSGIVVNPSLTRVGMRIPLQIDRLPAGSGSTTGQYANGTPIRARARIAFAGRPNDAGAGNFGSKVAAGLYNVDA